MPEPNKLDCTQIAELLGAFRDMELTLPEVEIVEAHLETCPQCRKELEAIEMVVASLKSLPELPTRDFADAIEARINKSQEAIVGAEQPKQPVLAVVKDNVRPLVAPARRSPVRAMALAAALLLCGLMAATTLAPKSTEVAQLPTHTADVVTASATFPDKRLEADKGAAPLSDDIVALYDEDGSSSVTDAGLSTNEDGLYAIKM